MTSPKAGRAVELLIGEADAARVGGRYAAALDIAGRAVAGAERLGDTGLLIRALYAQAVPLLMLGDQPAALARYTRVLGLAQDDSLAGADRLTSRAVFRAHLGWVDSARLDGRITVRKLFEVLDAADRWITDASQPDWRGGILHLRARLHTQLGEPAEALALAQEALSAYRRGLPGYTLSDYREALGQALQDMGRPDEAEPLYRAILDDPDAGAFALQRGWEGLARSALDTGRADDALDPATRAAEIAEGLGDESLMTPLYTLIDVHRARGDLDAATRVATRYVEAAHRIGGHVRPFWAVRIAADVARERGDHDAARALLDELGPHAVALDTADGSTRFSDQLARRRRLLDGG